MKLSLLFLVTSALVLGGCALTSKSEPMTVTLYSPVQVKPRLTAAEAGTAGGEGPRAIEERCAERGATRSPQGVSGGEGPRAIEERCAERGATRSPQGVSGGEGPRAIELGRIVSGYHLREKIMHRDSAHELGTYDDRRWTERPEAYVRRELVRTFFEERGFRRVLAGNAPILDVEVVSFEELRLPNLHAARIELHVVLHDAHDVFLEDTITIDKPAGNGVEGFVAAMAAAIDEASAEVARRVEKVEARIGAKSPEPRADPPTH